MSYHNDLWHELFGINISDFELRVMEGVERRAGKDETIMILSAILIFLTVFPLYRDPASPFVTANNLGAAVKDVNAELVRLRDYLEIDREHSHLLSIKLQDLNWVVDKTDAVLEDVRRDVKRREDFPLSAYLFMSFICFSASILGVFLTLLLVKSGFVP